MPPRKRRLSTDSPTKRSKRAITSPIQDQDQDDDLASIIAQIKAHEESEALARRLQEEWNAPQPSTSAHNLTHSNPDDSDNVIVTSDREHQGEDDEAMARRLAKEWEMEGVVESDRLHSSSTRPVPSTRRGKAKADVNSHALPEFKLERFKSLFTGEKSCSCGAKLPSPRGHVVFSQQSSPSTLLRLLHVPCKSCNKNHCRGCMTPVSCSLTCKGGDANCSIETCCTNVRIIAIYEALCVFDRQYLGERENSDQRMGAAAAKVQQSEVGSVGPGGTGYGTDLYHGSYGYPQNARRGRSRARGRGDPSQPSHTDTLALHFDEIIVRGLTTITGYMPSPYADEPHVYDLLPHECIGALLSLSQLPNLLGNLLRNDSVTDWITRINVYHATIGLLRRMADCELTLEVLIGPRWAMSKSCGLDEWMWDEGAIIWEHDDDSDGPIQATPLYVHFEKLTKQCAAFLAGATSMLEIAGDAGEDGETAVKATSLCSDIVAARDDIERAMTIVGKDPGTILRDSDSASANVESSGKNQLKNKGKERDPAIDLERTYARECERLAFQHSMLSKPSAKGNGLDYPEYYYVRQLEQTVNATRNPRDRLHLVKELAVMATSLPPGVWVRVDEVRNDAIKVMIAGPAGTPYAGGLFEFDCFIPLEYPNKPPLVHLRTTGGGMVRFNPNLYQNGKVCLSLLGTWPGRPEEQWSPKSTLLQVLVSIQSMILIDLPYFNEPGYGKADAKNRASVDYNKNICLQTTRWAIVDWLKDIHKNSIWAEVISSHFLTRHEAVRQCIQEWAKTQPQIRKYKTHEGINPSLSYMSMPPVMGSSGATGAGVGWDTVSSINSASASVLAALDAATPSGKAGIETTMPFSYSSPASMDDIDIDDMDGFDPHDFDMNDFDMADFDTDSLGKMTHAAMSSTAAAKPQSGSGAVKAGQNPGQDERNANANAGTTDLLAEYDKGIQTVRGWTGGNGSDE